MNEPKRIQRKRTKGWRMPDNTVYVGRPGCWGNPYVVTKQYDSIAGATIYFVDGPDQDSISSHGPEGITEHPSIRAAQSATELFANNVLFSHTQLGKLRGKDLACWCPLDQPCHADVLLEWANS